MSLVLEWEQVRRTVSGKDSGLGAGSLADHDGGVRVVLLHGRVGAVDESSVNQSQSQSIASAPVVQNAPSGIRGLRLRGWWTDLVAALCSEDWQKRKRSSFRPLEKTYLPDIVIDSP